MQTVLHARDGEDHINLSVGGRTQVGRMCALAWNRQFYIPHLGEFAGPRSFVQWISTGDDERRRAALPGRVSGMSSNDYHTLLLFAKYFQMTSFTSTLRNDASFLELPWVAYKQYSTGVRQYDIWPEYNGVVREYADFIIKQSPAAIFPWAELYPEVLPIVNRYLRKIVEAQGGEFVPFEELVLKGPGENRNSKPRRPRADRQRKNSFEGAGQHTFEAPAKVAADAVVGDAAKEVFTPERQAAMAKDADFVAAQLTAQLSTDKTEEVCQSQEATEAPTETTEQPQVTESV